MAYENTPDTGKDANGADATSQEAVEPTEDKAADAAAPEAGAEEKATETGTLLSGDESAGSGDDQEGGKSQEKEGEAEKAEAPTPDDYAFEAPEGVEISEDAQTKIDEFKQTAADMGLSKEQFQQLVEFDLNRGAKAQEAMAEAFTTRVNEWGEQVRKDKELGGEKLNENLGLAKNALEAFGSDQLKKMISAPSAENPEGLGLGNHPEFLRLMTRIGRAIGEDNLVLGDKKAPDGGEVEGLRRMYPSMYRDAS